MRIFAHERNCELVDNFNDVMSRLFSLKLGLTQRSDSAEQPDSTLHVLELVMQLLPLLLFLLELGGKNLAIVLGLLILFLKVFKVTLHFESVSHSQL